MNKKLESLTKFTDPKSDLDILKFFLNSGKFEEYIDGLPENKKTKAIDVFEKNYFWAIKETGLSKGDLLALMIDFKKKIVQLNTGRSLVDFEERSEKKGYDPLDHFDLSELSKITNPGKREKVLDFYKKGVMNGKKELFAIYFKTLRQTDELFWCEPKIISTTESSVSIKPNSKLIEEILQKPPMLKQIGFVHTHPVLDSERTRFFSSSDIFHYLFVATRFRREKTVGNLFFELVEPSGHWKLNFKKGNFFIGKVLSDLEQGKAEFNRICLSESDNAGKLLADYFSQQKSKSKGAIEIADSLIKYIRNANPNRETLLLQFLRFNYPNIKKIINFFEDSGYNLHSVGKDDLSTKVNEIVKRGKDMGLDIQYEKMGR